MSSINKSFKRDSILISLESIINKIERLFQFYCQFGERLNIKTLKSIKYIKLLEDCNILSNKNNILSNDPLSKQELEIIFSSESKNNSINFHQFLNVLMKISMKRYSFSDDKKRNTLQLMNEYLLPLYNKIFNIQNEVLNNSLIDFNKNIDNYIHENNIIIIIQKNAKVLFDIYKMYFKHEISISQEMNFIISNSEKKIFEFAKDFDISPGLISKSLLLSLFQSEINNFDVDDKIRNEKEFYLNLIKNINLEYIIKLEKKNLNILGNYFNFFKFIRLLIKIADNSYIPLNINTKEAERFNNQIKTFDGKFNLFLKKIELSKGFLNIPKENSKNHNKDNITLTNINMNNTLINKVNSSCLLKTNTMSIIKDNNEKDFIIGRSFMPNNDINEDDLINYHNNYLDLVKFTDYIKEKYGDDLKKIFTGLCSYGDISNRKTMKNSAFHNMLNYCQLIKNPDSIYFYEENKNNGIIKPNYLLSKNEVDIIFTKLANLSFENENNENINLRTSIIPNNNNNSNNKLLTINNTLNETINPKLNNTIVKKNNNYIIFDGFIICQEILSRICFRKYNTKESIDILITQNIFKGSSKFINSLTQFQQKIEKILSYKQKDLENINDLKNSLFPLFSYYSNNTDFIDFNQLFKFTKEYALFPSILNYTYLNEYFYYLSFSLEKNNNEIDVIDFDGFIDLIYLIAFDLKMETNDINERLYFLIDKFTLIQEKFNINKIIKEKFPERYSIKSKEEENDFFNIFY